MAEPQNKEQFDRALAEIELQLRREQLADLISNRRDAQEQRQQRENNRHKLIQQQKANAAVLADEDRRHEARVKICPHRKGGIDLAGWLRGTDDQFAICIWQMPNQDNLLWCSRCHNFLLPPVEPQRIDLAEMPDISRYGYNKPEQVGWFSKEKGDTKAYNEAMKLYRDGVQTYNIWLQRPTNNIPSTSCLPGQTAGDMDWKRLWRLASHSTFRIPIFQAERWPFTLAAKKEEDEQAA